jgi:hypothetical protein
MSMKNPVITLGIEPVTFRFVTQCLNHYATACPRIRQWRKQCKERAEWKRITEKAETHSGL